ncbi:unnamed protein product [Allacma fusca]|uniref:Rotatin n=1 Tax=Allacma fusca TaxID=39272 RepID=A0A8J2L8V1_9HEXA|nr:unnamed protein product [Allacma fusca]
MESNANMDMGRKFSTSESQELLFRDLEADTDFWTATNQLIANLGHDLRDVRLRALKCLWRKIDCGLVSTDTLSGRTDLINRLTLWIRADDPRDENYEGFQLVIRLFTSLSQHDDFRKLFIGNHLDTLLSKRRLEFGGEIRSSINRLLDRVGSFYIHCEGPADDTWLGNKSVPSISSAVSSKPSPKNIALASFHKMESEEKYPDADIPIQDFFPQFSKTRNPPINNDYYTPPWKKNKVIQVVSIKNIRLGPSDKRVLASTFESLNSKNEALVLMTCSFIRDVLLNDFPPEVFVQESAVSLSLAQIVQDTWMDEGVNFVAYQALIKLAQLLRFRFSQLNTSDYHISEGDYISENKGPQGYYGESFPLTATDLSASSTEYFISNICKILRVLSRSILYDSNRVTRWVLLYEFTITFQKCVQIFPNVNTKSLMMLLQEILYDLKSSGDTYSNSYSSRPLAPYLPTGDEEVIYGNFLMESVAYAYQGRLKDGSWEEPHKAIISFLVDIQNSSGHKGVFDAIQRLKEFSLVLLLKSQTRGRDHGEGNMKGRLSHSSSKDADKESVFRNPHWRDAFYRFLSVEPTSQEDEDLLVRVLDLIEFILTHVEGSHPLLEWVVPLCGAKGCAGFRLLLQHCNKNESDSSGTTLSSILRTLFDFYQCLLSKESTSSDQLTLLWELFSSFSQVMSEAAEEGYGSSATLHGVLYGIAYLSVVPCVKEKLLKNKQYLTALLHKVSESLSAFAERSSGDSFRNRGPIYYASLSMLHLIITMSKVANEKESTWEWIGKCIEIIPFLWSSEDLRARAAGFQICQTLCASTNGAMSLLSGLDNPALAWGICYRHLANPLEAPIVQHAASAVLVNLFNNWADIGKHSGYSQKDFPLEVNNYLEDMLKLISNVYWHNKLNRCEKSSKSRTSRDGSESSDDSASLYSYSGSGRSGGDNIMLGFTKGDAPEMQSFITPNVLSCLCKLFLSLVKNQTALGLIEEQKSNSKSYFVQTVINSGISSLLFRLLSNHEKMKATDMNEISWLRCCSALTSILEVLISISNLDRSSSVILIGDKRGLSHLIQLLLIRPPLNPSDKTQEMLSFVWINVFTLLSTLCTDAGNNFEDLERNVWSHWPIIFPKIISWLKNGAPVKCRQTVLTFSCSYLSMLTKHQSEKDMRESHQVLCLGLWKDEQCSYGRAWCKSLMEIWSESLDVDERVTVLHAIAALLSLSPDAKMFAIEKKLVVSLIEKIRSFGVKYFDPTESQSKKKNLDQWHDETFWVLAVLTSLLYDCKDGRETALESNLADNIHKIFKWWTWSPDRALLHAFIECLLNFTEEYSLGSHSLTVTTSLVGVAPRKVSTPQSLLVELLSILQSELDVIDKQPCLKTVDLCFSLLRNCSFAVECRTIMAKTAILSFIRRLHPNETKRWGTKQAHVKEEFLKFLVHVTINNDMQVLVAKVPECIEILLNLTGDPAPVSLLALQVLRNLCFNASNRPRFLCDATFIPTIVAKLRVSKDPGELESAGVTLWAIIANSEKGKLLAKQASSSSGVTIAIQHLLQLQKSSNDLSQEKQDFTDLVTVLSKVNSILGETRVSSH